LIFKVNVFDFFAYVLGVKTSIINQGKYANELWKRMQWS